MNPSTRRAGAVAMLLCACAHHDQGEPVIHAGLDVAPVSRGLLHVESEHPLTLGVAMVAGQDTLVAADRITNDLWLIDASTPELRLHRLLDGADRRRARLVAVSAGAAGWHLLDRSGTLHEFDAGWHYRGSRLIDYGGGVIATAAADGAGGFMMVIRRRTRDAAGVHDALVRAGPQGRVVELWQAPPASSSAAGNDILSLSAAPTGWLLAGTQPARVIRFDAAGEWLGEQPILRTPARRVGREIVEQFERLAAAGGMAGSVQPPAFYPAVTAMMQVGQAHLAVPYTGGPTGEAQGLDVYCDLQYSRTLLDAPDILQVVLAGSAIMVLRELPDFSHDLAVYRTADLPLQCGSAS